MVEQVRVRGEAGGVRDTKYCRFVLLVDDDPENISRMRQALDPLGLTALGAANGEEALAVLRRNVVPGGFAGIVVSDLKMPVMDGLEFLGQARKEDAELAVILISAYGEISSAVEAMKTGAFDFLERPIDPDDFCARVTRAIANRDLVLENRNLRFELANRPGLSSRIIGDSPNMQRLREDIVNVAATDATALIRGPTGSGKELVARALHEQSKRNKARFVAINCGALAENVVESELFGHEAGAFTDAKQRRIGLIEHAKGGTLFLDEIESMPLNLQVKLLRMLQERVITRLGSNEEIKIDIRIIAATKTDLREAAKAGAFREDLYYRLNVAELHIPPLNDRRADIPVLFAHFVEEFAGRYQRDAPKLSDDESRQLMAHDWRGNIRELRNAAERYLLGLGSRRQGLSGVLEGQSGKPMPLPDQLYLIEAALIRSALEACNGQMQLTAERLGIPRRTLNEKVRKHRLQLARQSEDNAN
jgi:two-component system, NtrC family, C4-dicarboxylate transport response regulator DctD